MIYVKSVYSQELGPRRCQLALLLSLPFFSPSLSQGGTAHIRGSAKHPKSRNTSAISVTVELWDFSTALGGSHREALTWKHPILIPKGYHVQQPLAITELNPVETGHSPPIKLINVLKTQSRDSRSGKWNYQTCVTEFRFPFSPVVELLQLACFQGKTLSNSMKDLLQIHWAEELPSFSVEFH